MSRIWFIVTTILFLQGVFASLSAQAWVKAALAETSWLLSSQGFPELDEYGDPQLSLPSGYRPNVQAVNGRPYVLRFDWAQFDEPTELDAGGFPISGDFYSLNYAELEQSAWTVSARLTGLEADIREPQWVSRLDGELSFAYWLGHVLHVETVAEPENVRVSLPIAAGGQGAVAIDQNGGIHVLILNANAELWHYYYSEAVGLIANRLSSGPVCAVVAVGGENDDCHLAYSTISEDLNFNGELDDGEDLNDNGLLDGAERQLLYQRLDATEADPVEVVVADTLLRLCELDVAFSTAFDLRLAYADPVSNSVRVAERSVSTWSLETVSSVPDQYTSVSLAVDSGGDSAVAYQSGDGQELWLAEFSGSWSATRIASSSTAKFFLGTDVVFDADDKPLVFAAEKSVNYLSSYSQRALPDLLITEVKPVSIRSAFIVTWPTPSTTPVTQVLQVTNDLSDPERWTTLETRYVYSGGAERTYETIVELSGDAAYYRVLEWSH